MNEVEPAVLCATLVAGIALAMLLHELGHFVVARAVGADDVRLLRRRMVFAVEAVLPSQRAEAAFLLAGCVMNLAAAAAFVVVDMPLFALVQFACALVNIVPHGTSDGAKLRQLLLSRRLRDPRRAHLR